MLVYGGAKLDSNQQNRIKDKAINFFIDRKSVIFKQGLDFEAFDRNKSELEKLKIELNKMTILLSDKDKYIDSISNSKYMGKRILGEIRTLYPQIYSCSYGTTNSFTDTSKSTYQIPTVIFNSNQKIEIGDMNKLSNWLKHRLNSDSVEIFIKY